VAPVRLSIIILNHNSGTMLRDCLDSLFADELPADTEVIVPDNASTDASLGLAVRKWGSRIRVIHNGDNRGFAWGNNRGLEVSSGEYVCLLNPDTIIRRGAFGDLVSFMDSHPRAGIVGPKVLNKDGSFQLSAKRSIPSPFDAISRALLLSKLFPRSRRFARYNVTYLDPDTTQKVDACTGCCMLARRKMIDSIGSLDEGYFIYCEDVDWFVRAKKAGWEVWYVASAVIEHHHAYSESFRRYAAVRNFHDSMIRFHRKHFAADYPALFNAGIYAAVRARMFLIMGLKTLKRWR
jgi:GT2 family glycosyltransferase